MFFPLVIIGLIFGGLLTLLCLVFAIISLAKERYRNALIWGGGFVVARRHPQNGAHHGDHRDDDAGNEVERDPPGYRPSHRVSRPQPKRRKLPANDFRKV